MAPEALTACLVTGGLASLRPSAAEVYRRTYPRALAKNREYERRYPGRHGDDRADRRPARGARTCGCPTATG